MIRSSEFLASEAHTLIDEGNVIGAVELSLAALPDAGPEELDDIPVTPNTVYALQRATSTGLSDGMMGRVLTTTDTFAAESDLRHVAVSTDGRYVATVDSTSIVNLWDRTERTTTYQGREDATTEKQPNSSLACLLMTDSGKSIAVYSTFVLCRDATDGTALWRYYLEEGQFMDACFDEATQSKLALLTDESLLMIDVETGTELSMVWTEDSLEVQKFQHEALTVNGTVNSMGDSFVAALTRFDTDYNMYCLTTTIDESGNLYSSLRPSGYVFSADIFPDGSMLMLRLADKGYSASTYGEFFSHPYVDTTKSGLLLTCLDSRTGEVRWEQQLTVSQVIYDTYFYEVFDDENPQEIATVACIFSDRIMYVDPRTGDVVRELMTASSITTARQMSDGEVLSVESDGSVFLVDDESVKVRSFKALKAGDQESCITSDGTIFLARENILYVYDWASTELKTIANANDIREQSYEMATKDGFLVVVGDDEDTNLFFGSYTLQSENAVWKTTLGDGLYWLPINYDASTEALYVVGFEIEKKEAACEVAKVSLDRHSVKRWTVASNPKAGTALPIMDDGETMEDGAPKSTAAGLIVGRCPVYHDGIIYTTVTDDRGVTAIAAASLEDETTTFYALPKEFAECSWLALAIDPAGNNLLFQGVGAQVLDSKQVPRKTAVLNLKTGKIEVIDRLLLGFITGKDLLSPNEGHVAWSDDGKMVACAAAGGVNVHRFGKGQDTFIKLDANRLVGMTIYGGRLVVALSSGSSVRLEAYDLASGALYFSSVTVEGVTQNNADDWIVGRWQSVARDGESDGSGDLFVAIGDNAYLVDGNSLSVCQSYAGGCVYNPNLDTVLYRSVQDSEYNVEHRHSLEELIELGKQMLGDKTMGDDWLKDHGIA